MMDEEELRGELSTLSLGGLRFYPTISSTNDSALKWIDAGASDMSLVVAEEQTLGHGRSRHPWLCPSGAGLLFSLILSARKREAHMPGLIPGLGAVAVLSAFNKYNLMPQVKWPNDILIGKRKVCGILTELVWQENELQNIVIGVGVNVKTDSVPEESELNFPAACLEDLTAFRIDRTKLLKEILEALIVWRSRLGERDFLSTWQEQLAFRGEIVEVWMDHAVPRSGRLMGLDLDGNLRLIGADGKVFSVGGEAHLRPVI